VSNTAWAYAKACHLDEALFAALARSTITHLEDFNVQDLVNLTWAFAKLGQFDAALFAAVGGSIKVGGCGGLCNLMQLTPHSACKRLISSTLA
jgi:hypothetical protein